MYEEEYYVSLLQSKDKESKDVLIYKYFSDLTD
jgi:hypothetical protein